MKLLCEKIISFPHTVTLAWVVYKRYVCYDRFLYRAFGLDIKCILFGDTACTKRNNGVSLSLSLVTATWLATTRSISPVVSPCAFCKGFSGVRVILLFPGGLSMFARQASLIPRCSNPNSPVRQTCPMTTFQNAIHLELLCFRRSKKQKTHTFSILPRLWIVSWDLPFYDLCRSIVLRSIRP